MRTNTSVMMRLNLVIYFYVFRMEGNSVPILLVLFDLGKSHIQVCLRAACVCVSQAFFTPWPGRLLFFFSLMTDWQIERSIDLTFAQQEIISANYQSCAPELPPDSLVVAPCCAFGAHLSLLRFFPFFLPPVASSLRFLLLFALLLSLPPPHPRLGAPFSSLLILIKEGETPSFINESLNEKGGMLLSRSKKKKSFQRFIQQLKSKEEILPEDSLAFVPWWFSFTLRFLF